MSSVPGSGRRCLRRWAGLAIAVTAVVTLPASRAEAAAIETERLYLSGRGPADAKPWELRISAGRRAGEWARIGVPSQWELEGFGSFRYGLDDPGPDEEGSYRLSFEAPAEWSERAVELVFEGVMTDCAVTLNGVRLEPAHRGGFTRFRYDVTALLRPGAVNQLEVEVAERSSDRSVEAAERTADYWLFGGIYRPVYLEARPRPGIAQVRIDARHDGALAVEVEVGAAATGGAALAVEAELRADAGGPTLRRLSVPVEAGTARLATRIEGVRAWSAEDPVLYRLALSLLAAPGAVGVGDDAVVLHRVERTLGFRTVSVVAGRGVFVNGRRVLLKGINRHSFWPTTGRALDPAVDRDDVRLLRALNANAVRSSHYPPDPEFLEACDRLGLYVIDELPGWHDAYDRGVGERLARELVARDHDHPSVVAWANGNEGGWNTALDPVLAAEDRQQRPVLHPGEIFGGVDARHYPSWDQLTARLDPGSWRNRLRALLRPLPVVLPTESLHGLYDGGLGAGLADFWERVRASPLAGGLFLWAFLDEGVLRADRGGAIDTFANYGADGVVGPFREKEGSFWAVRALWAPIVVLEQELERETLGAREVRLTLENRYDLIDLEGARLGWEWVRFPGPGGGSETVVARGVVALPATAPGERATVSLGLVEGAVAVGQARARGATAGDRAQVWAEGLRLRAIDRRGREVGAFVLPLRGASSEPAPAAATSPGSSGALARDGGAPVVLGSGDLGAELEPGSGRLLALRRGAERIAFAAGPRPVGAAARARGAERWSDAEGIEHVTFRYSGALEQADWSVEPAGWLRLEYRLRLEEPAGLVGLVLELAPSAVRRLRWLGRGPFRVWGNRLAGGWLGLWSNDGNEVATGSEWRYPELSGFYAGVRWATLETDDGALTIALDDPSLFLGVGRPRFAEGIAPDGRDLARHTRVTTPDGGLAVLHAIPGIGTKFHSASELGPAGRAELAPGVYHGVVRLRPGAGG